MKVTIDDIEHLSVLVLELCYKLRDLGCQTFCGKNFPTRLARFENYPARGDNADNAKSQNRRRPNSAPKCTLHTLVHSRSRMTEPGNS